VRAQTYTVDTIVVVDDGSSEDIAAVVAPFGENVNFVRQCHAGAAAARNIGASKVATEFVAFLDADDLWCPTKIECQLRLFMSEPTTAMVFGHALQFLSPDLSADQRGQLKCDDKAAPAPCCSSMLVRTECFRTTGGFDTSLQMGEFIEWFARSERLGLKSLMLPDVVFHRRLHSDNTGRRQRASRSDYARSLKAVLDLRRSTP
jgi:glycosyltransferase involved in cell wall biosynthesis